MSVPADRARYPDRIEQTRTALWDRVGAKLGPDLVPRAPLTDWEFAARYLKGTAFPHAGASRWFEPASIHVTLSALADQHTRLLVQLAREFAKSSLFSFIRPLRLLCEQRNLRIVIISKTAEAATRFTAAIKHQLETNQRLLRDFGPFQGTPWTDGAFTVLRDAVFKEPTLQAVGRGGQIVSGRYDLVILDDVEDYESTRTEPGRLKTFEWLMQDVVPVVVAGGRLAVIQTPQHPRDLVGQLRERAGIWHFVNFPAEVEIANPPSGELGRESRWPAKWPIYWRDCAVKEAEEAGMSDDHRRRLAAESCARCPIYTGTDGGTDSVGCLTGKRFEVGEAIYKLQYLVDPAAFSGGYFKPEYWRYYTREQVRWDSASYRWIYYEPGSGRTPLTFDPHETTAHPVDIVFGIDPAIAEENEQAPDATRSRFALVVLGYVHRLRRQLLLHYENRRVDFPTQKRIILEQFTAWRPRQIGIEEVAFQKALRQDLVTEYRLPVQGLRADGDKFRRILTLTPDCEAGHVYLRGERDDQTGSLGCAQREFQLQAEAFPKGQRDDLLDAWHYAHRLVGQRKMLEGYGPEHSPGDRGSQAPQPKLWTDQDILRGNSQGWRSPSWAELSRWARPS